MSPGSITVVGAQQDCKGLDRLLGDTIRAGNYSDCSQDSVSFILRHFFRHGARYCPQSAHSPVGAKSGWTDRVTVPGQRHSRNIL